MALRSVHAYRYVIVSLLACAIPAAVEAAEPPPPMEEWEGEHASNEFGSTLAPIGLNADNDGSHGLAIGAYKFDCDASYSGCSGTVTDVGKVYYEPDPRSGHTAWSAIGAGANDSFGFALSDVGDLDSDGVSEVLVGAYGNGSYAGKVYAYKAQGSGGSASKVQVSSSDYEIAGASAGDLLGYSVAGIASVNTGTDTIADVIVGAIGVDDGGTNDVGAVYAVSGADDSLSTGKLWEKKGSQASEKFGFAVDNVASLNPGTGTGEDYIEDVIVGVPLWDEPSKTDAGKVVALDGTNGNVMWTKASATAGDLLGAAVSGIGDLDDDGVPDVIAGAYAAASYAGKVYALSGTDGSEIWTSPATGENAGDLFGYSVANAGDVDGDNVDDVLVGAIGYDVSPGTDNGKAYILSGVDGSEILSGAGATSGEKFGFKVANLGSWNGDEVPDPAVSAVSFDCTSATDCGKVFGFYGRGATRSVTFDVDVAHGPKHTTESSQSPVAVPASFFGVNEHWSGWFSGFEPVNTDCERYSNCPTNTVVSTTLYDAAVAQVGKNFDALDGVNVRHFRYPGGLQANHYNWIRGADEWADRGKLYWASGCNEHCDGSTVPEKWIMYGIMEFLCEVEATVDDSGTAAERDTDGYLPVTITLSAPKWTALEDPNWDDRDAHLDVLETSQTVDNDPYHEDKYYFDQLAADLYEFLNAPDDGSNPEPMDGSNPLHDDLKLVSSSPDTFGAENIDWAAERTRLREAFSCKPASAGTGEDQWKDPFFVKSFELGNEVRPSGGNATDGAWYGEHVVVPMAKALRSIQHEINANLDPSDEVDLYLAAVSSDGYNASVQDWVDWHKKVWEKTHDTGTPPDWLCDGGTDSPDACFDAWAVHVYPPGASGKANGILFRDNANNSFVEDMEVTRRLPAGDYKFEYTGARQTNIIFCPTVDWYQELKIEVHVDDRLATTKTWTHGCLSGTGLYDDPRRSPQTDTVTVPADAFVRVRLSFKKGSTQATDEIGGVASVFPLVAAIKQGGSGNTRLEYFDLRKDHRANLMLQTGPYYVGLYHENSRTATGSNEDPMHLNDGIKLWLTEHTPTSGTSPMRASATDWQHGMILADTFNMLLHHADLFTQATFWTSFEDDWFGMIEGVGHELRVDAPTWQGSLECPSNDYADGECRILARDFDDTVVTDRPRLRPVAKVMSLLSEKILSHVVKVDAGTGNGIFSTGPSAKDVTGAEHVPMESGIAGFGLTTPGGDPRSKESHQYVDVVVMTNASSSPTKANAYLINLDERRPASVSLDFGANVTIDEITTLQADDYRVAGGSLSTNHEPENRLSALELHCDGANGVEQTARKFLPGWTACGTTVQERNVRLCSDPPDFGAEEDDWCTPDGDNSGSDYDGIIELSETFGSPSSVDPAVVTVPPASVTVVEMSL